MDIKELEAFVYVVENCSFSRAAELLHLTQPTISSHISALERKLGIKLVVRTTKETFPSDAGKLLYRYAKEILLVREQAAEALRSFSREMRGTISIASSALPSRFFLPRLLRSFREKYPDIAFSIQMENSARVSELVAARAVELGFCGTMVEANKCVFQDFASEALVLLTPNREPYRSMRGGAFPRELIENGNLISREKTSGSYLAAKALLHEIGIDIAALRMAVEVRSTENVRQMVGDGLGVAIVQESVAQEGEQSGRTLSFAFPKGTIRRQLYIVRHKNSILSPIAQAFFDYAAKYYTKAPG